MSDAERHAAKLPGQTSSRSDGPSKALFWKIKKDDNAREGQVPPLAEEAGAGLLEGKYPTTTKGHNQRGESWSLQVEERKEDEEESDKFNIEGEYVRESMDRECQVWDILEGQNARSYRDA